ncbi:hypothetical protein ACHAQH_009288 [Verticillium albo-atrum]
MKVIELIKMDENFLKATLVNLILKLSVGQQHEGHSNHRRLDQTRMMEFPLGIKGIDLETRRYWMRKANEALSSPCPFAPFGSVIVNHTVGGKGDMICTGENTSREFGNPILHGEMAAMNNCSQILTNPSGPYKLSPADALVAFSDLTLYTNAESCSMCASAIRWAGFREYVYGTSIAKLVDKGWGQIRIPSSEVFAKSVDLPLQTALIGAVLANETDPLFSWQFDPSAPCPPGCSRSTVQADSICSVA